MSKNILKFVNGIIDCKFKSLYLFILYIYKGYNKKLSSKLEGVFYGTKQEKNLQTMSVNAWLLKYNQNFKNYKTCL